MTLKRGNGKINKARRIEALENRLKTTAKGLHQPAQVWLAPSVQNFVAGWVHFQ